MDLAKNVLVPVDFAAPSLRACDRAVALARDLRARVTLVHAVDAPEYPFLPDGLVRLREAAQRNLRTVANALRPADVDIDTRIVEGSPWRAIVSMIDTEDPDLVVCGTHNRRGLAYLALGSVAERIVRASTVPVMTVPGFAFESREDAGSRLVMELPRHDLPGAISVVALGINAVPVAAVVSQKLRAPLDLWNCVPIELGGAIAGAMGEDELAYYDAPTPSAPTAALFDAESRARATLREELGFVRGTRGFGDVLDRLVVLIAEHVTSPAPVRAVVRALGPVGASGVVLVTPVASAEALREVRTLVDGVVCLEQTLAANAAAIAYRASSPPSYRKVRRLLAAWPAEEISVSPPTRFAS
jgi:nucleotide-binding universal stress UspA family protein/predicted phosphoribosyltransferase